MTELEKLKIVRDFLAGVSYQEEAGVTYKRVCEVVNEAEIEELKARADRAEAALNEAQDRALRFEKMLKAEEARKADDLVLDGERVILTALSVLQSGNCNTGPTTHGVNVRNAARETLKAYVRYCSPSGKGSYVWK